jgi:hypothetical protein
MELSADELARKIGVHAYEIYRLETWRRMRPELHAKVEAFTGLKLPQKPRQAGRPSRQEADQ